jgi:hypothetical protein
MSSILWEPDCAYWFCEAGSCFRLNSWGNCQCILYAQCTVQQWASVYSSMSVLWLLTVFPVSTIFSQRVCPEIKIPAFSFIKFSLFFLLSRLPIRLLSNMYYY